MMTGQKTYKKFVILFIVNIIAIAFTPLLVFSIPLTVYVIYRHYVVKAAINRAFVGHLRHHHAMTVGKAFGTSSKGDNR